MELIQVTPPGGQKLELMQVNIARGTTDPGYWVHNLNYLFQPKVFSIHISEKDDSSHRLNTLGPLCLWQCFLMSYWMDCLLQISIPIPIFLRAGEWIVYYKYRYQIFFMSWWMDCLLQIPIPNIFYELVNGLFITNSKAASLLATNAQCVTEIPHCLPSNKSKRNIWQYFLLNRKVCTFWNPFRAQDIEDHHPDLFQRQGILYTLPLFL